MFRVLVNIGFFSHLSRNLAIVIVEVFCVHKHRIVYHLVNVEMCHVQYKQL